jgi:FkbM family methyltransferase
MRLTILGLFKPEYIFQPRVLWRRLWPFRRLPEKEFIDYQLPWGITIRLRAPEHQSAKMWRFGVFDLAVTEALWRLSAPGETVLDIGANAGYMTSVLVSRVSPKAGGRVYAFEPHPEVFKELAFNVSQWHKKMPDMPIEIKRLAISDTKGQAELVVPKPEIFKSNSGLSTLAKTSSSPDDERIQVETTCLDDLLMDTGEIGVVKVDVEGHEEHVFKGAEDLLKRQRIRDIIFEENYGYPSSASAYLESLGYSVLIIKKSFFGPKLVDPKPLSAEECKKIYMTKWDSISFLATRNPARALERFKERGWLSLRRVDV